MTTFWDMKPCSLTEADWHFSGEYCLHRQVALRQRDAISQEAAILKKLGIRKNTHMYRRHMLQQMLKCPPWPWIHVSTTLGCGLGVVKHPSCDVNLVDCILYVLLKLLSGVNSVGLNRIFKKPQACWHHRSTLAVHTGCNPDLPYSWSVWKSLRLTPSRSCMCSWTWRHFKHLL
jgi:hypothetical protein